MTEGKRLVLVPSLPASKVDRSKASVGVRCRLFQSRSRATHRRASHAQEIYQTADVIGIGKSIVGLGLGTAILASLGWSALPLASSQKRSIASRQIDDEDANGVKWGVMTVLSFLPLFNWLAWIFAALEDEYRASFYYLLAFLYGLPQLGAGFDQNWFSIATILTGILHVQAERIADEKGIANDIKVDNSLQSGPEQATKLLQSTARTFREAIQSTADSVDSQEEDRENASSSEELKQWDRRFQDKGKR